MPRRGAAIACPARRALAALAVLCLARPAAAGGDAEEPSWLEGPYATGTWGGGRTWLEDNGLHIDLIYTGEVLNRLAGGSGARTAYRGNVDLVFTVDTGKLGLWPGGTLFVYFENGHGEGISPEIDASMLVSNLEAPPFTQLSEAWYLQSLFDERLRIKLGKQDANRDFAAARFPGNFVHSSYGVLPTVPMPSFAAPGLGAVLFIDPVPWLTLRTGIYEGSPEIGSIGFDTAFGDGGSFFIASASIRQDLGEGQPQAAIYTVGAWYHSADITVGDVTFSGSSGAFAVADVMLRLNPTVPEDKRSVQVFGRIGWTQDDRNPLSFYAGGGATYHGLRGGNDTLGLGGGYARFPGDPTFPAHAESFVEMFYKARFTPWFSVQPDVQLIVGPGGHDEIAVVGGVRFKLKL
ncbi:MAG TPA: carbohydrate porin [Haliangiales bacterium]|nr:carbohydrate porin [Haliangiales bacterium]